MISRFRSLQPGSWIGEKTPPYRRRSRYTFKAPYHDTVNLLDREIEHLGAKEYIIEADFRESDIRLDGMPRASARQPQFPGIRVFFESRHGPLMYQTDTCDLWQHNLRSIALGLEALRAVDRYGITHRAEQYMGFKAIEAPGAPVFATWQEAVEWLRVQAGIPPNAEGLAFKILARQVARRVHPDVGGSREDWDMYEQAVRLLKKEGLL